MFCYFQVSSNEPSFLEVSAPTSDEQPGIRSYQLRLVTENPALWEVDLQLMVTLTSQVTGQVQQVPVKVKLIKKDGIC